MAPSPAVLPPLPSLSRSVHLPAVLAAALRALPLRWTTRRIDREPFGVVGVFVAREPTEDRLAQDAGHRVLSIPACLAPCYSNLRLMTDSSKMGRYWA